MSTTINQTNPTPPSSNLPNTDDGLLQRIISWVTTPTGMLVSTAVLALWVMYFYGLGSYPLFDVDEPRYAETAREMIESGNWITPTFNYEPRLVKPVLFYWLIALSYKVFGVTEFAARLVSALTATAVTLGTGYIGYRVAGWRLASIAVILLATCVEMVALSRASVTDMTLSAFIGLTLWCCYLTVHKSTRWWLLAGVFSGLAILTKGPVGIVLPGTVLMLYGFMSNRVKPVFFNRYFPLAIVIALAIALPWFVLAYLENGDTFLQITLENNFGRFSGKQAYHVEPWYYFFIALPLGFLPWSFFLLPVVGLALKKGASHIKNAYQSTGEGIASPTVENVFVFSSLWAGFIFVFFSASSTKLFSYILPMYPGLAMAVAAMFYMWWFNTTSDTEPDKAVVLSKFNHVLTAMAWLTAITLTGAGVFALFFLGGLSPKIATTLDQLPMLSPIIILVLTGFIILASMWHKQWFVKGFVLGLLCFFTACLIGIHKLLPAVNQLTQGALLTFVHTIQNHPLTLGNANNSNSLPPILSYEITKPSLTFYTRRKIHHIDKDDYAKLSGILARHQQAFVITKQGFVDLLIEAKPAHVTMTTLDEKSHYSLVLLSN